MGPRLRSALLRTAAIGCIACQAAPTLPPPPRHLVLVTIDTLRADHVGIYGGTVPTPHLDHLGEEGVVVERASTHVPLTRPAHVSIFSGRLPTETGVRDNVSAAPIPRTPPLLAEVLRRSGFATAAFVSSVVVSRASGLDRGFELYDAEFEADPADPRFLSTAQRRGDETLASAVDWLQRRGAASRLFLWLHLYDPHEPYEAPEPYASQFAADTYAAEVAWSDALIGRLDRELERLGLQNETLLVVTSDHGEGLGEHGEALHGFFAYETTLRVPLLFRGPGLSAGTRLERLSGLVDLYPTVLDLLGVELPKGVELSGQSLAPALRGGEAPPPQPLYAETLVPRLRFGWSDLRVVRRNGWKYIQAPRPELYDLDRDPGESLNLIDSHPDQAAGLRRALETFLRQEGAGAAEDAGSELSEELLERLEALGYLAGSPSLNPSESRREAAIDPKDRIEDFRLANALMREGLAFLHEGQYRRSAERFERLIGRGIATGDTHLHLGRALLGDGDFEGAAEHLLEASILTPSRARSWLGLAEALAALGDEEEALAALREGQRAIPDDGGLRREEGRLLRRLGQPEGARSALERALAADPEDASAHAVLGEVLRDLGDPSSALEHLRRAVDLEPARAAYWNSLGMTLGGEGLLQEAEQAFRRACELDRTSHRFHYNLGLSLLRLGRPEEARPLFELTLKLRPDFRPAELRLEEITPSDREPRP